jgi:4-amino-4-deoxy-L-arabinose transferase-like glycosyltransferase
VIFDSALTFFVVLAIIAFYLGIEEDERWSIVAWVSIAFGVLTKGPVAIILPLFVAVPYAFRRKRSRAVWPILGIVAFAVVIAPWVWAVTRVIPDFLQYVFVTETAQRLTTGALKRTGPPWYFLPYVLGGAMPWSILAFGVWWRAPRPPGPVAGEAPAAPLGEGERMKRWFLLLWILVPFVFFSLSQSKRPQYILPIMPAIALVVAREWTTRPRLGLVRTAAAAIGVFGAILIFAPLFLHRTRMKPEVAIAAHEVVVPLGVCFVVGAIIAFLSARDRRIALAALSIPVLAIPLIANPLMRGIGEARSTKTLVSEMRPRLTETTRIVGVEAFAGSLAFYLRRPLVVITPDAEELTSNYLVRHYGRFANDVRSTIRPPAALEAEISACCEQRIYIVRNNDGANRARLEQHGMRAIAEGSRFVAYEQPVK